MGRATSTERKIRESSSFSVVTVEVNNVLINVFEKKLCKVVKMSFDHGVFLAILNQKYKI